MKKELLEHVLDLLHRLGRAATYGAVAGVVGGTPRQVMRERDKVPRHSWVVSKRRKMPTGYPAEAIDERLAASIAAHGVISDPAELKRLLKSL